MTKSLLVATGFWVHVSLKTDCTTKETYFQVCGINEVNKSYSHRSHVTSRARQKCASVHDRLQGKGHFTFYSSAPKICVVNK